MKIDTAEFVRSASRLDQLVRDGMPEIAFVGRSNVGKSTLMNRILQRKGLARTSRTPGRTRLVNYFLINRRFYFVDLPGYGFARASRAERQRWAELMEQYLTWSDSGSEVREFTKARSVPPERLLVQLVDGKVGATPLDRQAFDYFCDLGHDPLLVATKLDKVPRSRRVRSLKAIRRSLELPEEAEIVPFSAVSGEGVGQLWKGISDFLRSDREEPQRVGMT